MPNLSHEPESPEPLEIVGQAYAAALRGDVHALGEVLTEDVRWHAAGDDAGGCQNRGQALDWMGRALARGVSAEVLHVRPLPGDRVLVLLQRGPAEGEVRAPHGQILHFRDGKVSEIVVYETEQDALEAADAAL